MNDLGNEPEVLKHFLLHLLQYLFGLFPFRICTLHVVQSIQYMSRQQAYNTCYFIVIVHPLNRSLVNQ